MGRSGHRLVVQADEANYIDGREGGPASIGVTIDERDVVEIQELLSGASVGSSDLNVGLARMPPGTYHIKHHHPHGSEFYFFLRGSAVVIVDDEEVQATPGTTIYLPPDCVHAVRNDSEEPAEFLYGCSTPEYRDLGLVYDE